MADPVRRHSETGERRLDLLTWGFLPHWTKDPKQARRPINAKAETIAGSGMFRDAFARRRALIPAALFYEWMPVEGQKLKQRSPSPGKTGVHWHSRGPGRAGEGRGVR